MYSSSILANRLDPQPRTKDDDDRDNEHDGKGSLPHGRFIQDNDEEDWKDVVWPFGLIVDGVKIPLLLP
jgi:hypothetical protein